MDRLLSGHTPVLLKEVLQQLDPQPGQSFIDVTINGGGHSRKLAERIGPNGTLLGIEWDGEIYKNLQFSITDSEFPNNIVLVNDSYANLQTIARQTGFEQVAGILFDLGMSSWHFSDSGKGFTFQKDEVLDMRYGQTGESAADILNKYPREEISRILRVYGEERFADNIAAAIIKARQAQPIIRTFQLVRVVETAVPAWYRLGRRLNPATKTFQALRIVVNHELENVETGVIRALPLIRAGGRVAVISFHSLEDRIVKNIFKNLERSKFKLLTKKPIIATRAESQNNPRARSAKLRVVEKL